MAEKTKNTAKPATTTTSKSKSKDSKSKDKLAKDSSSREVIRYGRGERESRGKANMVRISARKLNDVARTIRLKPVDRALQELRFSKQRISLVVGKLLRSVVANAENNKQLDIDRLVVKEAWVGKARRMRRFRPRAKGRAAPIIKDFSAITIVLEERGLEERGLEERGLEERGEG